ncbi:hypothetical protein ABZ897_58335 [Nonomuraea sp. NPDC046802]|uniref:hypothetical protein n=1 Tax=Nonomuraea sp. NPDC046802 TaxID=3154919 RepID=UPI0033F67138
MSGLVQRLIARSQSPVNGIRPRPASMFEDRRPASHAQPPAQSDPQEEAPAPELPSTGRELRQLERSKRAQPPTRPDAPEQAVAAPPAEPRAATPPRLHAHPPATPVLRLPGHEQEPSDHQAEPSEHRPELRLPAIADAGRGTPLLRVAAGPVLAAPTRAQEPQDAAPAPPVVEISIGRLEVRTPQVQPAPQAKPARKDHAAVLKAYLRGRGKGELA